ncbi:endoribonuclease ysh1 [Ascosphaera acerosa]|nr:endoribonuclease ysh1 [Ascosphaera acerosa]
MATKRKASAMQGAGDSCTDPSEELFFQNLGAGNEVGRSCHILQYQGKTVMLDAGMHPAKDGYAALPFFDDFDLSTVDVLLISHFHLDHSAALPYVLSKTNFKGRVFMTHATKAIYKWLIQDNVRVNNTTSSADQRTTLYTEQDHLSTLPLIEAIDFNTTHSINGIRITPYPAGHVLGACMYLISIAGLNILFTGDYSREEDRHLIAAEVPKGVKIDVLITESTFGISSNPPRAEREAALTKQITSIVGRGGRVLMPVFALGRAQELLLILDEYWSRHPDLHKTPIYYIGNMARRCMVAYQTYIGAMNDNIKRLFRQRMAEAEASGDKSVTAGPWDFRHVRSLRSIDRFEDVGSCVMLASPGMLQTGTSRELLERWAPNERNGVIMTGYSVEGTMGKLIINEPDQIPAVMTGRSAVQRRAGAGTSDSDQKVMIPRRCTVDEINFAAHVDGVENRDFIEEVGSPVVILVHGEKHQMMRLKSKLLSLNATKTTKTKILTPANCEEVRIPFQVDKVAKVVGGLANTAPPIGSEEGPILNGVLVQSGFKLSLMAPDDLKEYAGLTTTTITCKERITLGSAHIDLIKWCLEGTFGAIEEFRPFKTEAIPADAPPVKVEASSEQTTDFPATGAIRMFLVMGCVLLKYQTDTKEIELEWEGNMVSDGIADAVMAVLLTVESSPASVRRSSKHCTHGHDNDLCSEPHPHAEVSPEERFGRMCMLLEAQFGDNVKPVERPKIDHLISRYQNADPPVKPLPPADISTVASSEAPAIDLNAAPIKADPAYATSTDKEADSTETREEEDDNNFTQEDIAEIEEFELARLRAAGIPFPGVEITIDQHVARVWLETLEVECESPIVRDRVAAIVERAIETVAGLWKAPADFQGPGAVTKAKSIALLGAV